MNFELLILVFSLFTLHNYWPTGNRDNSRTLKNILITLRKSILFKHRMYYLDVQQSQQNAMGINDRR